MSQMNAFMAQIAADAKLQERVAALPDAESFVALASELGFDISTADIPGFSEAELSEDDLANAAGGTGFEFGDGDLGFDGVGGIPGDMTPGIGGPARPVFRVPSWWPR